MPYSSHVRSWKLVVQIERSGSLSQAANALGLELPEASRMVRQLEKELGFELLDRKTKPAKLSPRGFRILPVARDYVLSYERLLEAAGHETDAEDTKRHIRVSLPANMNRAPYYALIQAFEREHPEVCVEIGMDRGPEGLAEYLVDIAFLGSVPKGSGFHVRRCHSEVSCLVASPEYLERMGEPRQIGEIADHTLLLRQTTGWAYSRRLECGSSTYYIRSDQKTMQGDPFFCRTMLLEGRGIAIDLSLGFLEEELEAGKVVPVLKGWHRQPWDNSVVCRREAADDPLVRELLERLADRIDADADQIWKKWYARFGIPLESVVMGG